MSDFFERAATVQRAYRSKTETIRGDQSLSDHGKRQRLADAYRTARDEIADLRRAYNESVETERATLRKSAFSLSYPPGASEADKAILAMAYRDALQRVEGLNTPADAMRTLEQAGLVGDRQLVKAVGMTAFNKGWSEALESYAAADQAGGSAIFKLMDFEAAHGREARLQESMVFSISRPNEVTNVDLNATPAAAE